VSVASEYRVLLEEVGQLYPKTLVVDAGLGTSMQTDSFREAFPGRYFNLGIAEQNAVGVASGLARRGFVPLVHSFSNFLARRAHDQIAVSVAWPGCNVKLIAGSCGLFDGRFGFSHTATDDLGAMAALPNMLVVEPGDFAQMRQIMALVVERHGPAYVRIRRRGAPAKLRATGDPLATAIIARNAAPLVTVVACGSMLEEVLHASELLRGRAVQHDLLHIQALRPLDSAPILESALRSRLVVVVENHVPSGGFGDAISHALGAHEIAVVRFAIEGLPLPPGDPAFLLARCGLDRASLAERITSLLGRRAGERGL
jgi:transketolase